MFGHAKMRGAVRSRRPYLCKNARIMEGEGAGKCFRPWFAAGFAACRNVSRVPNESGAPGFPPGGEVLRGLVLVNQVRGSVWAIDFPVYENTLVTFLAYPVLGAAVTVS